MGPYQRHYYRLGSVIRNTVSQAQDTLCRIQLGHIQRMLNDHYAKEVSDRTNYHINDHETGNPIWSTTPGWATEESKNRGLYPKSLGELCIELAQEEISYSGPVGCFGYKGIVGEQGEPIYEYRFCPYIRRKGPIGVSRDIQKLRETMYHKHTSPEKERKTAKSERLIELVRNA